MNTINGAIFRGMLESGCNNLNNHKSEVDALNVFPVPDGDTGTNMSMTFTNGVEEVRKSGSEQLPLVAKTLSRGLLMGARGNSGVILSQIFRGFSQAIGDLEELTVKDLSSAMLNGAKVAYKAVMRPVEGTILTVVRESTDFADVYVDKNPECTINEYIDILCKEGKASLDRTPELLPILKEARVVDSGGSGLLTIYEGFRAYLEGHPIEALGEGQASAVEGAIASGYNTEFILNLSNQGQHLYKEDRFRSSLSKFSENMTVIQDGEIVKVRVNTMSPGEVLNLGQRYGEFKKIQIQPVGQEEQPSILEEAPEVPQEAKQYAMIAVAAGDGLKKLFEEYRCDIVVSGGQTMNPSTEDFASAINKLNAEHIFIFPNNSNIILAAQQAAHVVEGKAIHVIPTTSIPQGLSACIAFNPDTDVNDNINMMMSALEGVSTGSVTYAIKNTMIDGQPIHEGDYMGILEKDIVAISKDKLEATTHLIDEMVDENSELCTLIIGEDASDEEVEFIENYIEDHYELDMDVQKGNQPVYCFIIGIE